MVEDQYGQEFRSVKEIEYKIRENDKGCDWHICCDSEDCDCDDPDICSYGNPCESCADYESELKGLRDKLVEQENDRFDSAARLFTARAETLGYDICDTLRSNRSHGGYQSDHGGCSETIVDNYDEETNTLSLHDEEIIHLCEAMGAANYRHTETDYDELRTSGISRDLARELI